MKIRVLPLLALVVGVAVGLAGPAAADTEAMVTATVTVEQVAVSVSPTSVDYEVVDLGSTDNVPLPASFTATNDGNVDEDFAIKGADTADWMLVTTAPGTDEYKHRASSDGFSSEQALTTTYAGFTTATAPASHETVSLKLDAPSDSTTFDEQSATVTLLATASS